MNEAWMLTFAVTVPFLCLGLLMWLARLEDTLGDGLEAPTATLDGAPAAAATTAATTAAVDPATAAA